MRITYIKLTGYIGIYNGLGLNELEIDLSPGIHKITVISGINGCGKSTLLKAMTILPDSSSDFIPDVPAEKRLRIEDGPTIYDICITSAAGKNGSRGVSKATISKNGVELNPNGNISSYKEVIYDEFELDSNFIALCRLSSDDRGLADKSPAERKKFMSFIVDSLDTYNAIYKNLNKKSSVFKSYINNLHNKIQNIGDEDALRTTLNKLKIDAAYIEKSISDINNQIVVANATIASLDPNGDLQNKYSAAKDQVDGLKNSRDRQHRIFSSAIGRLFKSEDEDIDALIQTYNNSIHSKENQLSSNEAKKVELVSKLEKCNKDINDITMRIQTLSSEVDPNLSNTIAQLKEELQIEIRELNSIGISDPNEVSKEELEVTFNVIETVLGMVDALYDGMSEDMINLVIGSGIPNRSEMMKKLEDEQNQLEEAKRTESILESDYELMESLKQRPKNCKVNDCPFIKQAYDIKSERYKGLDIESLMNDAQKRINTLERLIDQDKQNLENIEIASRAKGYLDRIRDLIESNKSILIKTDIGAKFINEFEDNVRRMRSFNEYRDMDNLKDKIRYLTYYKNDSKTERSLQEELAKQSNSETLLNELRQRRSDMESEKESVDSELSEVLTMIDSCNVSLNKLRNDLNLASNAKEQKDILIQIEQNLNIAENNLNDILSKSKDCVELMNQQGYYQEELTELNNNLVPVQDQISKYEGQLMMLDSYKSDYELYHQKYNTVEVLKKYSSPTTGIQTVFMNLYMSKTLELANNVLGMIFGGQYKLLDYVINESEFRMPFIGSGMVVDDISSGSTSQVCMMGMVMNLVLKYQASPKYNIASLDEIDGGLDTRNRMEFISVLYKLIDILNIDQLFIISHSLEIELSNVNIIKLKSYDDFGETSSSDEGLVLYDFSKIKH